jgi:hypothetical protein
VHSTLLNAIVQTIAGLLGGVAVSAAVREHSLGLLLDILLGALGGGLGGFILQAAIPSMVNGSGEANLGGSHADDLAIGVLAGFISGGLLVLIFSVLRFAKNEHFNNK